MTHAPHEEVQELLGAYAVGAVTDGAERSAIDTHLAACGACRAELDGHLETLSLLVGEAEPAPAPVWAGIAAAIAPRAQAEPEPGTPTPARVVSLRRGRRAAAWLAPVAAAAAAVLVTLVATGDGNDLGTPVRDAAVQPVLRSTSVAGTVALYRPDTATGRVVLDLRNVPEAPAGHHYEVWVLRPGDGEEMEPIGAFTPHEGTVRLELSLPGPGEYVAVDISVQENGGSPEHSGTSLARASLS